MASLKERYTQKSSDIADKEATWRLVKKDFSEFIIEGILETITEGSIRSLFKVF